MRSKVTGRALPVVIFLAFILLQRAEADLTPTAPAPPPSDVKVDVVVDMTDDGAKIARPTPDKPAYCLFLPSGYKERGKALPHYNQPPPPMSEVVRLVTEAMAGQGYLAATKQSPPSLVLIYWWGYIAPQFAGRGKKYKTIANEPEMLSMVGGEDADTTDELDPRIVEIKNAIKHPRYYLLISAFDYQAWLHHDSVLLWRAHISTQMLGHRLDRILPTLITTGAPLFGRKTSFPVIASVPLEGRIVVGAPVVSEIQPSRP